ncbi:MAG: hypothetical protein KDK70_17205 [Myxococcales bacterium]|nr:hypothetical protein [Myxococcales bacterium]
MRGLRAFGLASLGLVLACRPEPVAAVPQAERWTSTAPHEVVTGPGGLVRPNTLPAVPHFQEVTAGSRPPGAPTQSGRLLEVFALDDEQAIVRFQVPGHQLHGEDWWLALMNRDGSLVWTRSVPGQLRSETSRIHLLGDAVTVVTAVGTHPAEWTLRGFDVRDGSPTMEVPIGPGHVAMGVVEGSRRYDVYLPPADRLADAPSELIAWSGRRVLWRSPLPRALRPGAVMPIDDVIAVRSWDGPEPSSWQVVDAQTGEPLERLMARGRSCSDGERWFVIDGDSLLLVDPRTLASRRVTTGVELPDEGGVWTPLDCSLAAGDIVLLVARGYRKALVTFDGRTLERKHSVHLGPVSIGGGPGHEALPERMHTRAWLDVEHGGRWALLSVDLSEGRLRRAWVTPDRSESWPPLLWARGYVIPTRNTIALADARSGILAGHAMVPRNKYFLPEGITETSMWLLPTRQHELGTLAPRVVDLVSAAPDDVRGAVLADLRPAEFGLGGLGCPDPRAPLVDAGGRRRALLVRARLPPWDLDVLDESARILACAPGSAPVRLMAWYILGTPGGVPREDNALLMVEDTTAEEPRFTLVRVRRRLGTREWAIDPRHYTYGTTESVVTRDHRPTHQEVEWFLEHSRWLVEHPSTHVHSEFVSGNVVDANWREATGEEPWRSYPPGIEQPG